MPITLTNGHVQTPGAIAIPNGCIVFQLNLDATVVAGPFGIVPASEKVTFQFDSNGDLVQPAVLYSNAELNPQLSSTLLGTYYLVTLYDANGAKLNSPPMWWQFTQPAGDTVDISEITPFQTVGGTVIYYPVSFQLNAPTPTTLGGVFSNAGGTNLFITAINTNGSVSLAQPSFSNLSGQISAGQIPSGLTLAATTFSGLITAQDGIEIGVVGTTSGVITLDGGTSGQSTITAPSVAGTASNPISFSNGINIPSGTVYSINNDTGISRASAGVIDVGNGAQGNATGTVNAAQYNIAGSQIAAVNLANGVTGTGSIVLAASPTLTGTLTAAAISGTTITASAAVTAKAGIEVGVAGTTSGVVTLDGSTSGQATITAPAVAGTTTNPISISNAIKAPSLQVTSPTPTGALSGVAFGDTTGFGNGSSGQAVTTTALGTGGGPTSAVTVVGYLEINVGGTVAWIPYMQ
jgi:hypothetical protein